MSNPLRDNLGMKMKKRHQISRKAGILGTCRRLLLLAVRRVREEEDCRYSQEELPWDSPLDRAYSVPALSVHRAIALNGAQLPSEDALRVKSAEFWLKLGEVDEALRELDALPESTWNHRWTLETRIAAMGSVSLPQDMDAKGAIHAECDSLCAFSWSGSLSPGIG
jgi:hypothetical protein